MADQQKASFVANRKWNIGFHVFLSAVAALALVIMTNYIASRHEVRFNASEASGQKLSPITLRVLNSLTNNVKVIVFFDRREALFGAVSTLIKDYKARSPKLDVEFVDYRLPGRAEAVRAQYRLAGGAEASRVIFDCNGKVRTVLVSELSDFKISDQKEIRRTGFKGEQLFTSAILNVSQTETPAVYFVQGHNEHSPISTDDQQGYSKFAELLENNNIQVKTLNMITNIPADASVLIIAAPTRTYEKGELQKLDGYLREGGRAFVLFNIQTIKIQTGLETLLRNWSIEVGANMVTDDEQSQSGEPSMIVTTSFENHVITKPLFRSSLKFFAPRSIQQRASTTPNADAPKLMEIVTTSSSGAAITPSARGNNWNVEKTGSIPLVVAMERGAIQGMSAARGATRMVVVGDSLFLSNFMAEQAANADFGNLAVNWLLNRDVLLEEIGISPLQEYEIALTNNQMASFKWLFLGAMPGLVLLIGLMVWIKRRF